MGPSRPKKGSSTFGKSLNWSLAPTDELKREIQAVLTPDLRSNTHRLGHGRYDSFAYPAAEAYFHLAGGYAASLLPMHLKRDGTSHWWLLDPDDRIIDMTLGPRETSTFPYKLGKLRPFRHTPTRISRRAQTIMDRVRARRPTEGES